MAWERSSIDPSYMWRAAGPVRMCAWSDRWCAYDGDSHGRCVATGEAPGLVRAMEAADLWAYEQGYRPERCEDDQ